MIIATRKELLKEVPIVLLLSVAELVSSEIAEVFHLSQIYLIPIRISFLLIFVSLGYLLYRQSVKKIFTKRLSATGKAQLCYRLYWNVHPFKASERDREAIEFSKLGIIKRISPIDPEFGQPIEYWFDFESWVIPYLNKHPKLLPCEQILKISDQTR